MKGVHRGKIFHAALVLSAVLLPAALRADVIYTNFGDGDSFLAGSGLIVTRDGAAWSSVAVSFIPAAAYSLTSIEFAASTLVSGANGESLAIFMDDNGHPAGTPLETIAFDGQMTPFGASSSLLTVQSTVHPLLEAGQTYWVGMNGANGGLAVWNQTTSPTAGFSATDGAGNWSADDAIQGAVELDGTLLFETPGPGSVAGPTLPDEPIALLSGAAEPKQEEPLVVPEPGTLGLIGLGLAVALSASCGQQLARFSNQK